VSRLPELLDDLIDRVAADLTRAPHEEGYGERIAARLDQASRPVWPWMPLAAAAVLIAAVFIVPIGRVATPERAVVGTAPAGREVPQEAPIGPPAVPPPVIARHGRASAAPVTSRPAGRTGGPTLAIPPLEPPPLLALDALGIEALSVAAVDVGQLDVETLALEELMLDSDSKEQP
jgi:hypothetical protein